MQDTLLSFFFLLFCFLISVWTAFRVCLAELSQELKWSGMFCSGQKTIHENMHCLLSFFFFSLAWQVWVSISYCFKHLIVLFYVADDASVCVVVIKRGFWCIFVDKNSVRVEGCCQFAQNKEKKITRRQERETNEYNFPFPSIHKMWFLFIIIYNSKMDNRIFIQCDLI